jgi:protein SCO1/2
MLGAGLVTAAGVLLYQNLVLEDQKKKQTGNKTFGPLNVGGPFVLVDQFGSKFSSEQLKGKYALIYFGFTHCPDYCPFELNKLGKALDILGSCALEAV